MPALRYFIRRDGQQEGPYTLEELAATGVRPDDWVWCKGMPDWRRARESGDICRYFRQRISDINHPVYIPAAPAAEDEKPETDHGILRPRGNLAGLAERAGEPISPAKEPEPDLSFKPRTWITEAIIMTLLCFPPTGIIAIYYGLKSSREWNAGQKAESHSSARTAKMWCGITFFLGFIAMAIYSKILGM